jgi:hyperosmotically inducible periplasmic protein
MVKRFHGILGAAAAAVVLVAFVSGCTTTQSPKRQIDDNAITAAVKAKLTAARFSNIVNVDVNTTNGIVTLAGEVPNARVKADAEREVRTVDGVRGINNNLQVKNPPTP